MKGVNGVKAVSLMYGINWKDGVNGVNVLSWQNMGDWDKSR